MRVDGVDDAGDAGNDKVDGKLISKMISADDIDDS